MPSAHFRSDIYTGRVYLSPEGKIAFRNAQGWSAAEITQEKERSHKGLHSCEVQ